VDVKISIGASTALPYDNSRNNLNSHAAKQPINTDYSFSHESLEPIEEESFAKKHNCSMEKGLIYED
jgi:hypothetical protein